MNLLRHRLRRLHRSPGVAFALFAGACAAALLLHAASNLTAIGWTEFWFDEALTFWTVHLPIAEVPRRVLEIQNQPPLYFLALGWLVKLTQSVSCLRALSWLSTAALVVACFAMESRLTLAARAAVACLLVVTPFGRYLSQDLRPYSLGCLTVFVATCLLVRLLDRPGRPGPPGSIVRAASWAAAAVVMLYSTAFNAAAFACHGAVLLALFLSCLLRGGARPALRRFGPALACAAVAAAAYVPYVVLVWRLRFTQPMPPLPPLATRLAFAFAPARYWEALHSFLPSGAWAPALAAALAVLGVARIAVKGPGALSVWPLLFLFQVPFAHLMLYGKLSWFSAKYQMGAFPGLLVTCALGGDWAVERGLALLQLRRGPRRALPALALGLVAAATLALAAQRLPAFVSYLRAPLPQRQWDRLLSRVVASGRRTTFLLNPGVLRIHLACEAARHPEAALRPVRYDDVPSQGPHVYRDAILRTAADTDCYVYCHSPNARPDNAEYEQEVVPELTARGYVPTWSMESLPDTRRELARWGADFPRALEFRHDNTAFRAIAFCLPPR